jgi:hypothetical protein
MSAIVAVGGSGPRARRGPVPLHGTFRRGVHDHHALQVADAEGTIGVGAYDSDSIGDHDRAPIETLRTIGPRLIGLEAVDRDRVAALLTEDGTSPVPTGGALHDRHRAVGPRRATGGTPSSGAARRCRCRHLAPLLRLRSLFDDEDAYVAAIDGLV